LCRRATGASPRAECDLNLTAAGSLALERRTEARRAAHRAAMGGIPQEPPEVSSW